MAKSQRISVEIFATGQKLSLGKFKKEANNLLKQSSITKKEMVDSKILNNAEFNELIKTYKLPLTTKSRQVYVNRINFLKALKKFKYTKV